jgi:hypothetical protein
MLSIMNKHCGLSLPPNNTTVIAAVSRLYGSLVLWAPVMCMNRRSPSRHFSTFVIFDYGSIAPYGPHEHPKEIITEPATPESPFQQLLLLSIQRLVLVVAGRLRWVVIKRSET